MIKFLGALILAFTSYHSFSQGGVSCGEMAPICTDQGLNFTANSGSDEASTLDPGNDYDCLFSQPNPTWYYFQIATDGDLIMSLTAASDIDYAIWGPFTSLSVAQAACGAMGDQAPPNPDNGNLIDCSFSATNLETPTITGALTGQVYVMLITNYAGVVQNITLDQTGGTASTDCNIVTNPPCAITALNASISGCDFSSNNYEITGSVDLTDPPASGDLVIEDCDGNVTVIASAPFNATSYNFTISSLPANGNACIIQTYFTTETTCSQSMNYVAPACISNCPSYDLQASSATEACGNQMYWLEIENSGCNGFVSFDVVGNYGSLWANEISWSVVSNTTGNIVAQGGPGSDGGAINVTVGPLDPAVEGTVYTLEIVDVFGDGFNGTGGFIEIQENGNVLTNSITTFTTSSMLIVQTGIVVSSSTLSVITPSGVITNVTSNCIDHEIGLMLNNTNFCTPIAIDLPWSITCDLTGGLIASGIQTVTVFPQVPSAANDLVLITWNSTSCSWDVTPNNDCTELDIGTLFTITPDASTLGPYCSNGTESFSVSYLGFNGAPNCCSTAGPVSPITYTDSQTMSNAVAIGSPFGGVNNAALITVPGLGIGGNATSASITIALDGYCFDPPSTQTDDSYWVTIYVDGVIIYDQQHFDPPGAFNQTFSLANMPNGYNENSIIEVYAYPNSFNANGVNTTFTPGASCPSPGDGIWTMNNISTTFTATYEQTSSTPVNCDFSITSPYTCCTTTPLSATAPANQSFQCLTDVPASNVSLVTNVVSDCPVLVTHEDDTQIGSGCPFTIERRYRITDDCGTFIFVTQTFTIEDTIPPFFSAPPFNTTVECVGDIPVMTDLAWTDNCDGTGTVTGTDGLIIGGNCGGTVTRTWTHTDVCGNISTVTQTITIDDTTAPVLVAVPANIIVECVGDIPAMIDLAWTDNCDGTGTVTGTDGLIIGGNCGGTVTRTWTHTDVCGNISTVTQTITIDDTTAPVLAAAPANIIIECVGDIPAMIDLAWTDNCDGTGTVTGTDGLIIGGNCGGTVTRTWTHTDVCGNISTVTQTITIDDTTAPVLAAVPANIIVECVGDIPAMIDLAWTDNCDGTGTVTGTDGVIIGGNCGGTITRTWTHTDVCGNISTVTQTITIDDTTAPVLAAAPANIIIECVGDIPAMTDLAWTDNCDGTGTVTGTDGLIIGGNCGGTITRTWTYTDVCGNVSTVTQTITIDDTTNPTASNLAPINLAFPPASTPDVNAVTDEQDNCTVNPIVAFVSDVSDGGSCPETITRTYSITDDCENQILVTQLIVIGGGLVPEPTVSANGPLCEGEDAIFTIDGLAGATVTYDIGQGASTTVLSGGTSIITVPSASTDVTITLLEIADGSCVSIINVSAVVVVNLQTTPSFTQLGTYCEGDTPGLLSGTSLEGITGTWSPTTISTTAGGTITYSFTNDAGQCALGTTMDVEIIAPTLPAFTQIAPICLNAASPTLPVTSDNGITGTWSPSVINTSASGTSTYTFTPDLGLCATITTMDITIDPAVQSTFTQLGTYCEGDTPGLLSGTSLEGITGTWSPTTISTTAGGTITYSFTNDAGQCALGTTMDVEIIAPTLPAFTQIAPICLNTASPTLPVTSDNGITGTWSPSVINTSASGTSTYTFTPDLGLCATITTMDITIDPAVQSTFTQLGTYCEGDTPGLLSGTSLEGITGTWSPTTISTTAGGTITYSFTNDAGQCALGTTMDVEIIAPTLPAFTQIAPICLNTASPTLPVTSDNGITGTWSPSVINTSASGTSTYTFTPDLGLCATITTMDITIDPAVQSTFTQLGTYCEGDTPGLLSGTSLEGITGTWSPTTISTTAGGTITYSFTNDAGQCALGTTMDVEIIAPTLPAFTQIAPICLNTASPTLPVTSDNGITGTWSPSVINTSASGTSTYTFTPDLGLCATITTMDLEIADPPLIDAGTNQIINCISNIGGAQIGSSPILGNIYSWTPASGLSDAGAANPIANPTGTTTYTLTVTNTSGCSSFAQVNVSLDLTAPVIGITNNTGTNILTCTLLDINLTATGAASYSWDNGLGNIDAANITSPGIYTVTGTGPNGCEATEQIEIIQDNGVDLFLVLIETEICSGEEVLIQANSSEATSFDWSVVQNGVAGGTDGTIVNTGAGVEIIQVLTATGASNGTVDYTITPTLGGCMGEPQTVTVTVLAPLTPSFTTPGPFCLNDTPTALTLNSLENISGSWSPSLISTSTAGVSSYVFTPNPGQCALTQSIDITVNALPVVDFTGENLIGCAPSTATLTSLFGSGLWTISNGVVLTGNSVTVTVNTPGCYDVTLQIEENGCTNSLTTPNYICVEEDPIADFSATPDLFTDVDATISFTNLSSGATSFIWSFGDGNSSTYINPSNFYESTEEGALITLTAISDFGCTDEAQLIIEYDEQEIFYVPNSFTPDGDNFNQVFTPVFYSGFDPYNFEMLIFNRWGQVVFETHDADIGWDGTYGLKGTKASDGAYTWKIIYKTPKTDERKVLVGHVTLIR